MKSVTLRELGYVEPDDHELIWEFIRERDLDTPLRVYPISSSSLEDIGLPNRTLQQSFEYATEAQRALVARYRQQLRHGALSAEEKVLVFSADILLDGHHRALAAILEQVPMLFVDVSELDESRAERWVNRLLEATAEEQRKLLARWHSALYRSADAVIKRENPCRITHDDQGRAVCASATAPPGTLCCQGCQHHSLEAGCQADEPLSCKGWLCPSADRNMSARGRAQLDAINALRHRKLFGAFRGDKATALSNADAYANERETAREYLARRQREKAERHEFYQKFRALKKGDLPA